MQGGAALNAQILQACKDLIDDAKMSCTDIVFKEVCLEILAKARQVLTEKQFKSLVDYVAEKMREKASLEMQQELLAVR
ncbi:MAG: hypothetical protein QXQ61_04930 [Candidatus Bathyarchaeia archaeon]|nr:hypothetical protein [Candidatus Bathyarchaeota archaeon]